MINKKYVIIDNGKTYATYADGAKALGATKYYAGDTPENSTEGKIVTKAKHGSTDKPIYLFEADDNKQQYVIGFEGFKEIEPVDEPKGNPKYDVTIHGKYGTGSCTVDVYRVLEAFKVTNPQSQHAVKKQLATGKRGHKDTRQDLVDIVHSAQSALDMFDDIHGESNENG